MPSPLCFFPLPHPHPPSTIFFTSIPCFLLLPSLPSSSSSSLSLGKGRTTNHINPWAGARPRQRGVFHISAWVITAAASNHQPLSSKSLQMSWWRYYYDENRRLSNENYRLSNQNHELSRKVSTLGYKVQELEREKTRLSNKNYELSSQVSTLRYKMRVMEHQKTRLSNKNHELSSEVSTLENKVSELEHKNTHLSGELVKQREGARKASLLLMSAADKYQEQAKKKIRAKVEELAETRKAGLLIMNTADTFQKVVRKQIKAKEEELEDARKAVLVLMSAADSYQQATKKQIKEKVEELKALEAQKAAMDARATSLELGLEAALAKNRELEDDYGKVKVENDRLQSEVERLRMGLGALAEAEETSAKAFDAEKEEATQELVDLKTNAEEIQASRDLMNSGNDKFVPEVSTAEWNHRLFEAEVEAAEQKHSLFEAGVERLEMELGALV